MPLTCDTFVYVCKSGYKHHDDAKLGHSYRPCCLSAVGVEILLIIVSWPNFIILNCTVLASFMCREVVDARSSQNCYRIKTYETARL